MVFAQHRLATCRQQSGEDLHQYLQLLRVLAKECEFQAVTTAQYQEESIRDAFIAGIQSNEVCQRLLEEKTLTLDDMYNKAILQKNSEAYLSHSAMYPSSSPSLVNTAAATTKMTPTRTKTKCWNCGNDWHPKVDKQINNRHLPIRGIRFHKFYDSSSLFLPDTRLLPVQLQPHL